MTENVELCFFSECYSLLMDKLVSDNNHIIYGVHLVAQKIITLNQHYAILKKVHINFHNMTGIEVREYHVHRLLQLSIRALTNESSSSSRAIMLSKMISFGPSRQRISRNRPPLQECFYLWYVIVLYILSF